MCGIVGIVSRFNNGFSSGEMDMFTTMLFVDTLRGFDSTGVFGVDMHGNVDVHKEASNGASFIQTEEYKKFVSAMIRNGAFVVGHNRAATRGTVSDENAHPFVVDDKIVLVQNGTMRGDHKRHADVEVDSHAIAHILSDKDDITEALDSFDAAYALVWYNTDKEILYIIRNNERPLFIAEFEQGGFVFASELATLWYGLHKSGMSIKFKTDPYQLPAGTLLECHIKDRKFTTRELSFRPKQTHSYYGRGPYHYLGYDDENTKDVVVKPPIPQKNSDNDITRNFENIIHDNRHVYAACHGSYVDADNMSKRLKDVFPNRRAEALIFDYEAANFSPNCSRFHMIGCIDGEMGKPSMLFHYFHNGTEQEALELIGTRVTGHFNTVQINHIKDKWAVHRSEERRV